MSTNTTKALELLDKSGYQPGDDPATAALVYATLEVANQQRLTNLLELNRQLKESDDEAGGRQFLPTRRALREQIITALGVDLRDVQP
jgi:hypothetical protein